MEKIRCLMMDMPQRVLVDIVHQLAEEHENVEVVGRIANIEELPVIIKKQQVDVLITGMVDHQLTNIYTEIQKEKSKLLVVSLIDDGRHAAVYLDDVDGNEIKTIIKTLGKREA